MAAITIDSPRWRDGWGDDVRHHPAPALRLVDTSRPRSDRHLVRRRRLVVLLTLLVLTAAAIGAVALNRPATAGALPQGRQTHVVEPGDTYWSIAADVHERGDLRVTVDALIDANGARPLLPGDVIELPH